MSHELEDHTLAPDTPLEGVRYELRPCRRAFCTGGDAAHSGTRSASPPTRARW